MQLLTKITSSLSTGDRARQQARFIAGAWERLHTKRRRYRTTVIWAKPSGPMPVRKIRKPAMNQVRLMMAIALLAVVALAIGVAQATPSIPIPPP